MHKRNRISYAQTQLPFAGTGSRALVVPFRAERRAVGVIGAFAALLIGTYGVLVGLSVAAIAERGHTIKQSRVLTAQVAELENRYLAQTRAITPEYATARGFVPSGDRVYVTRLASYAVHAPHQ